MASPGNTISRDHRGPAVDISVWSFFVVSGLSVAIKVWTKLYRTNALATRALRRLQLDDYIVILSLVFTTAFSITTSQQVTAGLGAPIENVGPERILQHQKLAYVAQICYVCASGFTNAAGILFGLLLQPSLMRTRFLQATMLVNILWFISGLFAVSFQCRLPHTWAIYTSECIDQTSLWIYFESMNLLINLALAAMLSSILWVLQMSRMKYLLIAFFLARTLIVVPIVFKIIHLRQIKASPHWLLTPELATGAIISAAILNTNVVITCLPFLKQTMEYLMPGWSTSSTNTGFMRGGFGYSEFTSKSDRSVIRQ